MINTLEDYISNSLPLSGDFVTNPNLTKKVSAEGHLLPYRGNTVVFLLDAATKQQLLQLQQSLYQTAPEMLAEPLQADTFHMTLHDLVNGTPEQRELEERMQVTAEHVRAMLNPWKTAAPLPMKATWLFNMVNTSIVLGLTPADADTWQRLDGMYSALETVVPLGYGLTPHITMAYFCPGVYNQWQVQPLREALRKVELSVTLSAENLVLQTFENMNHYQTVF